MPFSVDVRSPRLIGYACGIGSEHATSREGPAALQDFLADIGSAWRWQSIVGHPDALAQLRGHAASAAVAQVCEQLARETRAATLAGHFPIVVGGDHSSGVGTWAGVARPCGSAHPRARGRWGCCGSTLTSTATRPRPAPAATATACRSPRCSATPARTSRRCSTAPCWRRRT
ncbi:arginase family protein [Nannocystis pusilla]|uniref:arginase family protein n=1 Tax=Nannocystis pusilla TaxID=889268 RepID=UPI003B7C1557